MRMLLKINIPHETFNVAIRDGSAGKKIKAILDDAKPESVYFTEMNGGRCAIMVVDMDSSSSIPALAEPWFLTFNAAVEFHVAMSPEDLQQADLDALGKKWG